MASTQAAFTEAQIQPTICNLSQDFAAPVCGFQACKLKCRPFGTAKKGHRNFARRAITPRASDASCDKSGPQLFGVSVPPVRQAERPQELQQNTCEDAQPLQRLSEARAALRAHGNKLKHVAAGIAISAALFAGMPRHWLEKLAVLLLQGLHC